MTCSAGVNPGIWKRDTSVASPAAVLPMAHTFEAGADRWCIGHIPFGPCVHTHSGSASAFASIKSTTGVPITVAACIVSQTSAIDPSAWRARPMRRL